MKTARISLSDLLDRTAVAGRPSGDRTLKASSVYFLVTDPFWTWCDLHAPRAEAVVEESDYDRIRMQRGVEFETQWVHDHFPDALRIEPEFGDEALVNTIRAMRDGVRAIYQPHLSLRGGRICGRGDLLIRVDGKESDLGDYSYRVLEVKRSREVKRYHALQAAFYHHIVSAIQGRTLTDFTVVLAAGEITLEYAQYEGAMREAIDLWRRLLANQIQPDPPGADKTQSPWRLYANRVLRDRHDLTLLPGVGPKTRERIRKDLGAQSVTDLFECSPGELIGALGPALGTSIYYGAIAYRLQKPVPVPGNRVIIPRGARATYALDFETSDSLGPQVSQPPHCYLAGLWDFQTDRFVRFFARGPSDESRMFEEMLDYVGDLDGVCVHTWTAFENGVLGEATGRHPHLADRLKAFTACCVDLKDALKSQVHLPVPTWSIKQVGPALGFHWRHSGFGAFDSMTAYWRFLETGDESLMQEPFDYHEDDVAAMAHIAKALDGLGDS
ncbi:MAG: TM0106 family RecB-like putative nuclease [Planctomycetes bacterium]|nr:TM0106 family RecB-like putative nuclease [Planctomycetota bacterium]